MPLAVLVAGSAAASSATGFLEISAGLLIGGACSILIFWLKVGELLRPSSVPRRQKLGSLMRRYFLNYGMMAVVLVACGLTSRVNLWAAGGGLLLCNLVIILSAAFQASSAAGQAPASKLS